MRNIHYIDSPGIDSMDTIKIGGINQCIYVRGKDVNNPIILFLHGGPGTPEMPLLYTFQYDWEENFTVVHWDQRGTGKTYFANDKNSNPSAITFEQSLDDALELTHYLQERFHQNKIIVLGYSSGSALGTALVQSHPEAFSAYIGVGQLIDGKKGEKIGFDKALDLAKKEKNTNDVEQLEILLPYPDKYFDVYKLFRVRKYQIKYNLAVGIETRSIISYFFSPYISLKVGICEMPKTH